ncbi:hypothetical protein [Aeromonas media]|uniref:hypothetical protein n=1 Tax=Aeromonas media TaxID=651 RepID=UPI0015DCDFEE|nr:hypothetical protein [Aeromonas media]BBS86626.1 hypothetical protein WP7W18E02_15230 [Aeromonas media]
MNTLYISPFRQYATQARIVATTNIDGTPCSYVDDLTWDYHGMFSNSFGKALKINFGHIDMKYRHGVQYALHAISKGNNWGFSTILNRRSALLHIAELIECTDWSTLNSEAKYNLFKKALKSKNLSNSVVTLIQITLNDMFDIGITQRFIAPSENFIKKLSSSRKNQQSIALPEQMMNKLLSKAIYIVEAYHPYRYAISAAYETYFAELDHRKEHGVRNHNLSDWAKNNIKHGIPFSDFSLDGHASSAIEIQTACWLVLIGLSGIRTCEGLSMNAKSYDDSRSYNGNIIPLIHGKISKSQPTGKPKAETWITHPIVKLALELAYDMSMFARTFYLKELNSSPRKNSYDNTLDATSSAFLILSRNKKSGQVINKHITQNLLKFAEKYDVRASADDALEFNMLNPTRKGQLSTGDLLPKLSNHDFRRSYAVFFMRNRFGNLMSLRSQFKHQNINMTYWYQNGASLAAYFDLQMDVELQKMIQTANQDIHEQVLFYIYNDAKTLSGVEGHKIISDRKAYQTDYPGQIYMTNEEIKNSLRKNKVSVVEHPTGYCFNPKCDRICSSDKASEICAHEVVTPDKAREALPRHQRLVSKFRALNNGRYYMRAILADIQTHIKSIEKTLNEHDIPFEPFTDLLNSSSIGDVV